ncbi:MAG: hypothetical protein IT331_20325 [Anaerolineae bacterium]|nr:hypothetical protein [Anaerolineae bacterium]
MGYLTGESSGDFPFGALFRAGFCSQPTSIPRGHSLELDDLYLGATTRRAPLDHKPAPQEFANRFPFLTP